MPRNTKLIHGTIDPYAPGGIDALFAHHHAIFGDAVMEAGADGGGGDGQQQGADGGQGGQQAADGTTPPAGEQKPAEKPAANVWDDPAKAKAEIERLQRDAASANGKARDEARAKAAEEAKNELIQQLGKTLGLVKDGDDKPNAEQLAQAVSEKDSTIASLKAENAILVKGGSPLLLTVLKGEGNIQKLDPNADDFDTKLGGLITDAEKRYPQLKTSQVAGRSGAEFNGGSGEQRTKKSGNLTDAVAGFYGTN